MPPPSQCYNHNTGGETMNNLKMIRESKGLTQKALAEASGVNKRMVEHYEQGFHDINKAEAMTVYKLSRALGCQMEDLLQM